MLQLADEHATSLDSVNLVARISGRRPLGDASWDGAMKLAAIIDRGTRKDMVDLY